MLATIDLTGWVILSVVLGAATYFLFVVARRGRIELEALLSCAVGAAGVPTGIDLLWCAFNPAHLVYSVAPDGKTVLYTGVIYISEFHRVDMAIGALAMIFLGVSAVLIGCKKAYERVEHAR